MGSLVLEALEAHRVGFWVLNLEVEALVVHLREYSNLVWGGSQALVVLVPEVPVVLLKVCVALVLGRILEQGAQIQAQEAHQAVLRGVSCHQGEVEPLEVLLVA